MGELLSGSSPPAEFFNPSSFVLLVSLYGSGAVVVRELRVRWRKGVGTVLLLGAAYGVLEEGLMVTSFFSPNWPDLQTLGVYGRWLGVNWVWAEMLTIYHAVFSITIPIILVELVYYKRKTSSWIGKKMFVALLALLFTVTVFGFFSFSIMMDYWTPVPQYLFALFLMIFFTWLARKLPAEWGQQGSKTLPKPRLFLIVSALAGSVFFLGFWLSPFIVPWPIMMIYGPLLVFLMARFLKSFNWREKAIDIHLAALCSGALMFFIVLAPLQELDNSRTDITAGMSLVSLASAIGLIWLGLQVKHRKDENK